MKDLQVFEGNEVEVFSLDDEVYFNPTHVAMCLGLEAKTVKNHMAFMNDRQVVKLTNDSVSRLTGFRNLNNAGENFLTEAGVYKIIFKSRKPEAERFQDWVTDEVLPTVRKTGGYLSEGVDWTDLDNIQKVLDVAKEERIKRIEAEKKLVEAKPKVEYYDNVLDTSTSYTTTQIAKENEMTAQQLNILLQQEGIQFKQSGQWLLKSKYQDQGLTKTRTYLYEHSDGRKETKHSTTWTEKGREFIRDFLETV